MIKVVKIDKEYLSTHIYQFINILAGEPHEYWGQNEFLMVLPDKWNLSIAAISDDNQLLGYIIASNKKDAAHIHKLMIRQQNRAEGLGTYLMNAFFHMVKNNFSMVTLKVYKDNQKAIKFYYKLGFTLQSETEDLLFFRKDL